ncbi:hypothetical protein [Mesorhizobium sp. M0276]
MDFNRATRLHGLGDDDMGNALRDVGSKVVELVWGSDVWSAIGAIAAAP